MSVFNDAIKKRKSRNECRTKQMLKSLTRENMLEQVLIEHIELDDLSLIVDRL